MEKRRSRRGWGWACALETAGLGQVGKVGRRESNGRVWAGAAGMKRDSGSTVYSGLQRFNIQMHIQCTVYYGFDCLGNLNRNRSRRRGGRRWISARASSATGGTSRSVFSWYVSVCWCRPCSTRVHIYRHYMCTYTHIHIHTHTHTQLLKNAHY